jgi:hypothetical protein
MCLTQPEAGLEIFTFFAAVYCISQRPLEYRKRQKFYIIYGGALLSLATIEVASDALWGQDIWIDHRNNPGGPLAVFTASHTLSFGAGAMANILGDGMLVRHDFP